MTEATPTEAPPSRPDGPKTLWRNPWFWGIVGGLIAIPAMRPFLTFEPPPPPVLAQLAEFSLTDAQGEPYGSAELEGQVWVVDFFFTRCQSICPMLSAAMSRLDKRYRDEGVEGVHLVSISVDPEYDTPERLREYGSNFGVDPERWTMLTGDEASVRTVVIDGFKTSMDRTEMPAGDGLIDVAHTGKFVIVDYAGRIRGYYDYDELGLDEIFHRSQHVLHERR